MVLLPPADRLSGDSADRVADLDHEAGRRRDAVAGAANAPLGLALEGGANRHGGLFVALVGLDQLGRVGLGDQLVLLEQLEASAWAMLIAWVWR